MPAPFEVVFRARVSDTVERTVRKASLSDRIVFDEVKQSLSGVEPKQFKVERSFSVIVGGKK